MRDETTPARHYAYEDEDQRPQYGVAAAEDAARTPAPAYNSIDNIAEFFASRGKKFARPKVDVPEPDGRTGFRPGQRVRHPKYGEGTVFGARATEKTRRLRYNFQGSA